MVEPLRKHIPVLEAVLKQLTDRHEQLLVLMKRQREALRLADHHGVSECSRLENALVQAIGDLEKRRQELVAQLTRVIDPSATQPMRMRDLAERLPEPARGRLLVLREQLRERIALVKDESSVTRRATEALLKHMQGLVTTLGSAGRAAGYAPASQPQPPTTQTFGTLKVTA
ncbi:MAG: flagellar export chaperone FlgN [Phycisphaeraceae bacterium]